MALFDLEFHENGVPVAYQMAVGLVPPAGSHIVLETSARGVACYEVVGAPVWRLIEQTALDTYRLTVVQVPVALMRSEPHAS